MWQPFTVRPKRSEERVSSVDPTSGDTLRNMSVRESPSMDVCRGRTGGGMGGWKDEWVGGWTGMALAKNVNTQTLE